MSHYNLYAGIYYYRLRQVDINGESSHSVIQSVLIKESKTIAITKQTPEKLYFNQSLKNNNLSIFDLSGKRIHQTQIVAETNILNWTPPSFGVYFIQIIDENNEPFTIKLMR